MASALRSPSPATPLWWGEQRHRHRPHLPRLGLRLHPTYTTLTQLVVDYYWIAITRGVKLREREEISRWLSW